MWKYIHLTKIKLDVKQKGREIKKAKDVHHTYHTWAC